MSQGICTPPDIAAEIQVRVQAGESLRRVAADVGLSNPAVNDIAKKRHGGSVERVSEALLARKRSQAAREYEKLSKMGRRQAMATMEKAGPYQAAMIAAIATDKAQLLSGQPTSITETRRDGVDVISAQGVAEALQTIARACIPRDVVDVEARELPTQADSTMLVGRLEAPGAGAGQEGAENTP